MDEVSRTVTMKPDVAGERLGLVEIEDEATVAEICTFTELGHLPGLTLIFPEVLDDERTDVGD
jgi:hypothetical protein